ncbi:MAG: undecaprenyldiphospho-muramoylpentapeptide beta-N-acetylglucosaminyltransferase [Myxococcales bacterium]|nr:undecaprenyldiphospho-muramoylpentapeptide beta-N-acetylglucosaminyltransferase [Myxococcota bacterium]MDW8280516.1 undecaprenyldiphospho-muramoylpentapeptide beta-N-acetylglucosaminyltransferase [Myxococcales bacterium]
MGIKIIIAGGGTGGHLFPGLAVADELCQRGASVSFVGTRRGLEARLVPQQGYRLAFIDVAGIKGRGLRGVLGVLRWPVAVLQTLAILVRERPDVVVGVGGYASGPVVLLAALLRIPTAVLEQNSVPGVTNRILGRFVDLVFTAFPESGTFFPTQRVRLVGNPVRRQILQGARVAPTRQDAVRLLVLGGSQGARAVNDLVVGAVASLVERGLPLPRIHHQTGPADEASVRARYEALHLPPGQVEVSAFIDDMAGAYGAADLVVGRAGATTLAELTALGLPAVLIPYPFAADDHQTRNARYLEAQGAARVLVQSELRPKDLADVLHGLCTDRSARERMAQASLRLGRPGAAGDVAEALLGLVRRAA